MKNKFLESKFNAKEYVDDRIQNWKQDGGNSDLSKDMFGETSWNNEHNHEYEVDLSGKGSTKSLIPKDFDKPHDHTITDWKVSAGPDGHIHFVEEGNKGYVLQKESSKVMPPKWAAEFQKEVFDIKPELHGKIEWDTATYLYSTGLSPKEAVQKYLATQS